MKAAILILFIVSVAGIASAQPAVQWQHIYGDSLAQSGTAGVVRLPSGDLIIAGDANFPSPQLLDIHLTRITTAGDSVFMRPYVLDGTQHAYSSALGTDNNIAVSGSFSYESNGEYYTNVLLALFDEDGNHIGSYNPASEVISEALAIAVTQDGGYLLAGYIESDPGLDPSQNLLLIRLNQQADYVWQREFDLDDRDQPCAVIAMPNGSFVIAGNTRTGNAPLLWRPFLIHIDANGDEINRQVFPVPAVDQFVYDLQFTPQGRLYIAGETWIEDQPGQQTDGFLTLLDFEFTPIATEYYGGLGYDGFRCIEPLPNGDLLLAGHAQSFSGNWTDDIYIVRVNPIGVQQWHGSFGDTGVDKGYAIVPVETAHETQYIVTGTSTPSGLAGNKNVIAVRFAARAPLFELELDAAGQDTIDIPAAGGSFDFTAYLTNNLANARVVDAWAAVVGPAGQLNQPLHLSTVQLQGQSTQSYQIMQPFPAEYAAGIYLYIGCLGHYPTTVAVADTLIVRKLEGE